MTHPEPFALAFAAMLFGVVLLFFSIRALLGVLRDSEVARMPAAAEQTVNFPAGGAYILYLSGPRLSKAPMHAKFSLRDGGAEVPSMPKFRQLRSSGFSTASISLRRFHVPHAGTYRLLVTGIAVGPDLSRTEFVFRTPNAGALVLRILGIILGGVALVSGIVLTSLTLTNKL
jgi:hypothetical protein